MSRFRTMRHSLLGAALFLSLNLSTSGPADSTVRSTGLKRIVYNGAPLFTITSITRSGTTYMPIWYVMQVLTRAGIPNHWTGTQWDVTASGAPGAISYRPNTASQRAIVWNGKLFVTVDVIVQNKTTYMPIWYVMKLLRQIGLATQWNGTTWSITRTTARQTVLGFETYYQGNAIAGSDLTAHRQTLSEIAAFSLSVNKDGSLSGDVPSDTAGRSATGLPTYLTINNFTANGFDPALVDAILTGPALRATVTKNIVDDVMRHHFDGANLDFELIPASRRALYASFLATLSTQLHANGKRLSVDVPAQTDNRSSAYDYAAIGRATDEVVLMAYDYAYPGSPPGAIAPVWWVQKVLVYAVSQIPAGKILLGLPAYGYDWYSGKTRALKLSAVDSLLQTRHITPQWDNADQAPFYKYNIGAVTHVVYYENERSLAAKLQLAKAYSIRGVAMWRIGSENEAFWRQLAGYATP